jgi:hypothetical protein
MLPDVSEKYLLPVERNDWPELLREWRVIVPEGSTPWVLSRFGELFLREPDGRIGMLQVSGFRYEIVAQHKLDFQEWLENPDKMSEWFLAPLVDRLVALGKSLTDGRCYSFITPLGMGGTLSQENVMVIPIQEHFGLWGEVFRQVNDLPEGSQPILKWGP